VELEATVEILKRQAKRQQAQMDAILATVCSEAQCDAIAIETVEAEEEDEDEREDQEQDYDYDDDDDEEEEEEDEDDGEEDEEEKEETTIGGHFANRVPKSAYSGPWSSSSSSSSSVAAAAAVALSQSSLGALAMGSELHNR
jgi:hypothetical protein